MASRVSLRSNESSLKTLSVCGLHEEASEEVIDDEIELRAMAVVANVAETAS